MESRVRSKQIEEEERRNNKQDITCDLRTGSISFLKQNFEFSFFHSCFCILLSVHADSIAKKLHIVHIF